MFYKPVHSDVSYKAEGLTIYSYVKTTYEGGRSKVFKNWVCDCEDEEDLNSNMSVLLSTLK